MAWPTP